MTADPRAALTVLIAAFERHLEACSVARGETDPVVAAAADSLVDAFERYDDALMASYGELTPLEVYGDEDDEDGDDEELDDHEDEDGDEDRVYSGLAGDIDLDDD
ncbi:MAG: primosomal protein [Nostocoides sp.]